MEAIAFSALIAAYLLIPYSIFRYFLGRVVPLKVFQESKTEEITRAVVTLFVLFSVAILIVRYVPFCKDYPWPFSDTPEQRASDYRIVLSSLHSEELFKDYGQKFWDAMARTLDRQFRVIAWYYLLVVGAALYAGRLSRRYWRLKNNRVYKWFADTYLLPHISQWHPLLSGFTFPPNTAIKADVLMTNGVLYDGEIADYFLNRDGTLAGLFLKNPRRFERDRYLNEREEWGLTRDREKFWRKIPSAKLYLIGSQIVNLNLRYEPPTASSDTLQKFIENYLKTAYPGNIVIGTPPWARSRPRR